MGGKVLFAINLVAWPDNIDKVYLREVLRGGAEKVAEAGGVIAGGHSVNDKEPKYGLAVTGIVDPNQIKAKGGAQVGDVLLLTKPLGVGVITTALKREMTEDAHVQTAVSSMKTLNKKAAEAAQLANANGMTDITGFGLLGHAIEMARQEAADKSRNVDFRFFANKLPWHPGTRKYGEAGAFPGGMGSNMAFFQKHVTFADHVDQLTQDMLWTPETSGGMLVAVAPDQVDIYQQHCETAVIVGEVVAGNGRLHIL